ncbi:hypothetical protein [Streptomyces parvus]|uniref:hypothetical protein n=1 Tax=Streptomyces parvus TaxID=66428 RepID=UPI00381F8EFF
MTGIRQNFLQQHGRPTPQIRRTVSLTEECELVAAEVALRDLPVTDAQRRRAVAYEPAAAGAAEGRSVVTLRGDDSAVTSRRCGIAPGAAG